MSKPHDPLEITPSLLLRAYANGVFPMSESRMSDDIYWVDPKFRGIIPLNGFHVSRSLRKFIQKTDLDVVVNSDFNGTVAACADREETWINDEITELYATLHRLGYAHSIEVRQSGVMVGGVYGVTLGGAFFGESMFSYATNMSKVALVWLIARLKFGGYRLFDTQFITDHLKTLGAIEVPRAQYQKQLCEALEIPADFFRLSSDMDKCQILHLSTQTS